VLLLIEQSKISLKHSGTLSLCRKIRSIKHEQKSFLLALIGRSLWNLKSIENWLCVKDFAKWNFVISVKRASRSPAASWLIYHALLWGENPKLLLAVSSSAAQKWIWNCFSLRYQEHFPDHPQLSKKFQRNFHEKRR
jgi:hypothetical protein